ncbi:glutathionylspermidine synthase family protein [Runella zeae]|jgi:glutathionylspermidine synthase|uniref:glutathionylspermidine synthase family protein n=1 Tax=Runella zeae TaxID=94255 RepID=UPI00048C3608|nr:glutathionylspermidine synthase family protein [Runella zeae]
MINTRYLNQNPEAQLRNVGWDWMLGADTLPYLANEVVTIKSYEAEAYFNAANELYEIYTEAAQHAIDRNLWKEMGIPENLIELIKITWEDDRHWHIYGRFDLAGGVKREPIKLIEFNADTATCIPETAVVQWAHLKANQMDESQQFNNVYEALKEQFAELRRRNMHLAPTLLFSTMRDAPEDDTNVAVLGEAAREAGFDVEFSYMDEVEFSPSEGIFKQNPHNGKFEQFDFWFKLVPWEYIGYDEPDLAEILTQIVKNGKAMIINPAYTLLFQSKYILKLLWDLYPNHPLLLPTMSQPLTNKVSVEKVLFGREGANVRILESNGAVVSAAEGDYGDYEKIYQEYVEFPRDALGQRYQAGVFWAGEACGLGYRRGGKIIDNTAQFVGHIVE